MSFYKKYELLEVLRDDGVKTFQAKESDTGPSVEVHLLVGVPGKSEPPYELLDLIRAFPKGSRPHLVEIGEHMGTAYVVTLPLAGYASFRDWAQSSEPQPKPTYDPLSRVGRWQVPGSSARPPAPAAQQPRLAQPDTPDITRMFQTANVAVPRQEGPQTAADQSPRLAAAPQPPVAASQGDEFNRLFAASPSSSSTGQMPAATPPAPEPAGSSLSRTNASEVAIPSPASSTEPGDFTRMFQVPTGEHKVPKPPLPLQATGQMPAAEPIKAPPPGEITSIFELPTGDHRVPSQSKGKMPAAEPAKSQQIPIAAAPGDFTSMFQVPASESKAPPTPLPVQPASQMPVAEPSKSQQMPKSQQMAKSQQMPASAAPGEFTRMFQVANEPDAAKPAVPLQSTGQVPVPKPSKSQQMRVPTASGELAKPTEQKAAAPAVPLQPTGQVPVPKPSKSQQMPAAAPPPGEFTSIFQTPPGSEPAKAAPPPQGQLGEFTRMFQAAPSPGEPPESATPAAPTAQKAPSPPGQQQPSEFTRMFSAAPGQPLGEPPVAGGASQPTPPKQAVAPPGRDPGEFTRIFSTPAGGSFPKQSLPIAAPQQSQPNPFAPPTASLPPSMVPPNPAASTPFSQQKTPLATPSPFGQPQTPGAQPGIGAIPQRPYAAPAQPTVDDEYARLFGGGTPKQGGGFPASPGLPASAPPPVQAGGFGSATQSFQTPQMPMQPAQPQGPSEYTRMFNARDVQPPQAPVPIPVPTPAPKPSPKWPLFLVGGILLLVVIGLVIALVRK